MERTFGIISDTHGLIRPEALAELAGVERILHAGDVGSPAVLEALSTIAPVTVVRGNNDKDPWGQALPLTEVVKLGGASLYLLHDIDDLDIDPVAAGFDAVVTGHSHRPKLEQRGRVLWMNPGSAGPRRFALPVTLGKLHLTGRRLRGEIIELGTNRAGRVSR